MKIQKSINLITKFLIYFNLFIDIIRVIGALTERYKNSDEKFELDAEDGTFLMSFKDFR
jgi:hypothetical protein